MVANEGELLATIQSWSFFISLLMSTGDCIVCTEESVVLVKSCCDHEALVCQICLTKVTCCPVCRGELTSARKPAKRSRREADLDNEFAAIELELSFVMEDLEATRRRLHEALEIGLMYSSDRLLEEVEQLEETKEELMERLERADEARSVRPRRIASV